MITLDQGVRSLCEREGGVQGPVLSCQNQPQMWPLKRVLRGPQRASLQEETNLRAVADLPLPAGSE